MTNKCKNLFVRKKDWDFCPSGTSLFFFVAGKEQRSRKENLLCTLALPIRMIIATAGNGRGKFKTFLLPGIIF
jgi:hypothetical protein